MSDPAHKDTDKLLEEMERKIRKEYRKAEIEIAEKLADYLRRFEIKDKTWQKWVKEGKKTEKEYKQWRVGQIAIGKRWSDLRKNLASDYHNANKLAKSVINGYMPEVYANNRDYGAYEIEHGLKIDTSYVLTDRQTVERLLRENPKLMHDPGQKKADDIAAGKDVKWNEQQIQSVMIQALLQGKSMPDIATSLAETVGDKDRNAAIRNARTMTTGVENAGRVDSYNRARKMGIDVNKQWLATLDSRTRHSHRVLDGEIIDINATFSNGCKFPGDPDADASEIFNCRCTLIAALKGFERDLTDTSLRRNEKLGSMSYEEWKKEKRSTSDSITKQDEIRERMRRIYINEYRYGFKGQKKDDIIDIDDLPLPYNLQFFASGDKRAKQYRDSWKTESLEKALKKFAPNAETDYDHDAGKIIYNDEKNGYIVIYDYMGNYFRIQDLKLLRSGRKARSYVDINGNDVTNEIVDGKQRGRSKDDYRRVTHFNNGDV